MNNKHFKNGILIISAFLALLFSNGRWFMPVMAWIYPILMLRLSRKFKPFQGYLFLSLIMAIANQVAFLNFVTSDQASFLYYLPAFLGPMIAIPYLLDSITRKRITSFLSTFIFPATYVLVEYFYSLNPFGSTGVLGYTQYQFTTLSQIASITGIWGITFLITWSASLFNWVYEKIELKQFPTKEIVVYMAVMLSVLLFGSVRLIIPMHQDSVRVTGLHVYDLRGDEGSKMFNASKEDWDEFKLMSQSIQNRLFEATRKEAQAGANIVVWSEISPSIAFEQMQEFVVEASRVASEEGIYLVTSPYVTFNNQSKQDENKIMMFNPNGELIMTHYKYGGNIIEGSKPGNKIIQSVDTEHGRLTGVICWDQDFPNIMRQVGKLKAGIILAPTADWLEITPLHSAVGYYRSIENGAALIRQNVNGLSIITDQKGRILTSMNHFTTQDWVMTAQVPTKSIPTVYTLIGDLFVGLCAIYIGAIIVVYIRKEKSNQ